MPIIPVLQKETGYWGLTGKVMQPNWQTIDSMKNPISIYSTHIYIYTCMYMSTHKHVHIHIPHTQNNYQYTYIYNRHTQKAKTGDICKAKVSLGCTVRPMSGRNGSTVIIGMWQSKLLYIVSLMSAEHIAELITLKTFLCHEIVSNNCKQILSDLQTHPEYTARASGESIRRL